MQSIGRNDTISVPGLCTPVTATIRPSVAAMLYAGAVEETAITTLDSSPSAPARRPLSWAGADAAGAVITAGAVVSALTRVVMGSTAFRPDRVPGLWQYCIAIPYCCTGFRYEVFSSFRHAAHKNEHQSLWNHSHHSEASMPWSCRRDASAVNPLAWPAGGSHHCGYLHPPSGVQISAILAATGIGRDGLRPRPARAACRSRDRGP